MNPRPRKHRHCECPFRQRGGVTYKPISIPLSQLRQVRFPADELEALRLCDVEGLTQEEAGERMGVSRGTVQRLVTGGRKRLLEALLAGDALVFGVDEASQDAQ